MSTYNKVIWSEGLFLRPQHFQQQDRHAERHAEALCRALVPYSWGFTELELERDLLTSGKIGIRRAAGVFPDGTPFQMPEDDPLPPPLSIAADVRDQVLFLALPQRRPGAADVRRGDGADGLERHDVRDVELRDATRVSGELASVEVGAMCARLVMTPDVTAAYACMPLAHVVEVRPDRSVILDDAFIPTVLCVRAASQLVTFLAEVLGLIHQRGEALAGRLASTGRGGASEIADFVMLLLVNRLEPVLTHHAAGGHLHPEALFQLLASLAGELATLTTNSKRPPALADYRHEQLRESFQPVMAALRAELSAVLEQNAIPIPVERKKFGVNTAVPPDKKLYRSAVFILAARADMPAEELRRRFPSQVKVGPVERIVSLVNAQLPGVSLHHLPTAPRQIPFHAGFVYFEFDQSHEMWQGLESSGALAVHVSGDFPELTLEMWAIRS